MAEKRTIELEVKSNLDESTQSVKSLKAQLKELKAQLALLDEGSDEFKNLVRQAGELEDRIGDVNQQVKNFASDTRKLDVAMQGVSAASGAFEAFEGTMALVGVESEDLQKTMVKLQAVMAVTNGIQSVANALNKDSALTQALNTTATKGAAIAQTIYTVVIGASTGALKAFKIALATTGIGALVVGLGYAITAMDLFSDKTKDEEKAQKLLEKQTKQLEKTIERYNEITAQATQTIDNATRSELALARQRGASQMELTKITKKGIEDRLRVQKEENEQLKKIYLQQSKTGSTENYEKARKAFLDSTQKTKDLQIEIQEIDADIAEEQRQSFQQTVNTASTATQEIVSLIDQINTERIKQIEDEQKRRQAEIVEAARIRKKEIKDTVANAQEKATLLKLVEDNMLVDIAKLNDEFFQKELDKEKEQAEKLAALKQQIQFNSVKQQNEFLDEVEKISEENTNRTLTDQEKETRVVNDKYFRLQELAKGNSYAEKEIEIAKLNELNDINLKYQDIDFKNKEEADKKEKARIEQLNQDKLKLAKDGLQLVSDLADLFGSQDEKKAKLAFQVDKAAKISSATITGYEAVLEAYKTGQKSPLTVAFPAYPYVQAGLAGAFASVNIAKIAKSQFKASGGGGSTSSSGGGGGAGAAPMTANFNTIGSSGINQLAQLQQTPTQAYVVSGEVTSAQALDRNRVQNATL
jgi:hypothetical protein